MNVVSVIFLREADSFLNSEDPSDASNWPVCKLLIRDGFITHKANVDLSEDSRPMRWTGSLPSVGESIGELLNWIQGSIHRQLRADVDRDYRRVTSEAELDAAIKRGMTTLPLGIDLFLARSLSPQDRHHPYLGHGNEFVDRSSAYRFNSRTSAIDAMRSIGVEFPGFVVEPL